LFVGKITINVNGMSKPRRTPAVSHQTVAPASHAASDDSRPTAHLSPGPHPLAGFDLTTEDLIPTAKRAEIHSGHLSFLEKPADLASAMLTFLLEKHP